VAAEHPIFAEIDALLSEPTLPALDRLEETLTSGYAAALALEAEQLRLDRRIADVATRIASGRRKDPAEIVELAGRLQATSDERARLRERLSTLRARAQAVRAAA
jgi:hypothetical protein